MTSTTQTSTHATYFTDTFTLSTASSEPPGFSGSGGYEFSLGSNSGSIEQGGSLSVEVLVSSNSFNSYPVQLALGPLPFGITARLEPNIGLTPLSALLTLSSNSSAAPGSYPITVSSSSAEGKYTATYWLSVAKAMIPLNVVSVQVHDIYGSPIPGAAVILSSFDGTSQSKVTNSSGLAEFSPVPSGMFTVAVSYMGLSDTMTGDASQSPTLYATLVLSYPVVFTIASFGVVVFIGLVLRRLRRPALVGDDWLPYS
jgi:carboxypeptidase family protein